MGVTLRDVVVGASLISGAEVGASATGGEVGDSVGEDAYGFVAAEEVGEIWSRPEAVALRLVSGSIGSSPAPTNRQAIVERTKEATA